MIFEGLADEAIESIESVEAMTVVDRRAAEQAGRRRRVEKDVRKIVAETKIDFWRKERLQLLLTFKPDQL